MDNHSSLVGELSVKVKEECHSNKHSLKSLQKNHKYRMILTVPATMSALKISPGAPILTNPQTRPRAERLATVGAEILDATYLLINKRGIKCN